jgi:N utilization substance protein A
VSGTESFLTLLEQVSGDVGVPLEDLRRTVEDALAVAYMRAFEPDGEVNVTLDPLTGSMRVTSAGGELLPVDDFKRLAAQTARTVVMRQLRDLEREHALSEAARHQGELASGVVDRLERGNVYVDLGRVEGWMPPDEQVPGELLRPGKPVTVVVMEPTASSRQARVRVSRASRSFVLRLLEAEVPEIGGGLVEIKAIAREPGLRTKVAVASHEIGIDPVGACVGPKGVRHRSLLAELGREHIDFVPWEPDDAKFVAASLGPATVVAVDVDVEARTAHVRVPPGQLSLAIGRDGQNARLAARLTGWRIDIRAAEDGEEPPAPPSRPGRGSRPPRSSSR